KRVPFHLIGDDGRVILGKCREVKLEDWENHRWIVTQNGDMEFLSFDEFFDQNRRFEGLKHLIHALGELGKIPNYGFLFHSCAGILARWLHNERIAQPVPAWHF